MTFEIGSKYRQMLRAYKRFEMIGTNNGNDISNVDAADAAEEFFVQCYHFKDWLKKAYPKLSKDIEQHITDSQSLSLAADFCNTRKHAGINRQSRHGEHIVAVNTHMKIDMKPNGFVASSDIAIKTDSKCFKGLDVASQCLREWNQFLNAHQVIIPQP